MTAIEAAAIIKQGYHRERLVPGIRQALEQAVVHGISHIRAFADTDSTAGLEGIAAVLQGRDEFAPLLTVQTVAFPQDGVIRDPPAREMVRQALEMGADVVGGIPWIEFTREDEHAHIVHMMDLAQEFDRDVSMLVDDAGDAGLRTLELLAVETDRRRWHRRVTAQHARAMALYPEPYLRKVIALLRRGEIGLISDPHTGPLHAPIQTLRAAGIPVGLGQDDITDAYYPFGRNNMLEVAFLCAHILWMTSTAGLEDLYDMITTDAARVLNLSDGEYGLAPGGPADLVIHRHRGIRDILREHAPPAVVIHGGRVVAADGQLTIR
jgi:cytosine deaminase